MGESVHPHPCRRSVRDGAGLILNRAVRGCGAFPWAAEMSDLTRVVRRGSIDLGFCQSFRSQRLDSVSRDLSLLVEFS